MKPWHSTVAIDRTFRLGRLSIHVMLRRGDGFMGRLGGGWAWKFGAMGARNELLLELFVMSIRFSLKPLL